MLCSFIRESGWKDSCAELNSLRHLEPEKCDSIFLVCSDTRDGRYCAEEISDYLMSEGYMMVFVEKVEGLTKNARQFKKLGLINLVNKMTTLLMQGESTRTSIVSTGGFKAQIAYSTLLGVLFNVPVYYIHEDFSELVELPSLPIHFDFSAFEDAFHEIEAVVAAPGKKEASPAMNRLPDEMRTLVEDHGDRYGLSPVGQAVQAAYTRSRRNDLRILCQDSHHTVFGPGCFEKIAEVPDEDFRCLVRMMKRLYVPVSTICMDAFSPHGTHEPEAEFIDDGPGYLKYKIWLREGWQMVKLLVPAGQEKSAKRHIGQRIVL
ncbi:MAG: putative CRISPR-associated protein [Geobacteraceae bacterium]|nr:putative CRISPR-associated protein [Geobacteraceae bacterium]